MLGRGGAHIAQVRLMSGARVMLQAVSGRPGLRRRSTASHRAAPCCGSCRPAGLARADAMPAPRCATSRGVRLCVCVRASLPQESEDGGRVLVVVGQPDQCHTAHSMVNTFMGEGRMCMGGH